MPLLIKYNDRFTPQDANKIHDTTVSPLPFEQECIDIVIRYP